MFWNKSCQALSNKLGLFKNIQKSDQFKPYFNEKYGFQFFKGIQSNKLDFIKIPQTNNLEQKLKLKQKLLKQESTRYNKEVEKNKQSKSKTNKKSINEKHRSFLKKIDIKVNDLDMLIKTRKVRLAPNDHQKVILLNWLDSCDNVYNDLIDKFYRVYNKIKEEDLINKIKEFKNNDKFPINFIKLRNKYIHSYTKNYNDTPFCVLSNVIKEFVTTLKSIFTKISKRQIKSFQLNKRSLTRPRRTVNIDHKYLSIKGPYPSFLGSLKIKNSRSNNKFNWKDVRKDFKIVYCKFEGNFYLHAPILVKRKEVKNDRNKVVALDPGENKFVTGYSPDHCFYTDSQIRDRIRKQLKKIDKLKSKITKKKKRKWKYKKAIDKIYTKIRNDRDELHNKLNLFLVKNYERIIIPEFSSKQVSRKELKLNPMTKRVLGQLSHYKMREKLKGKCEEYSSQYIIGDESYTSKTCGKCGSLNEIEINQARQYKCKKCKVKIDRDMNGSRNILIKNREKVLN